MGYRETVKFALSTAVLILVAASSGWAGYTFGYLDGYSEGWDRSEFKYREWRPPGEPMDWSKFDPSTLKGNLKANP
jgi:hypothetical protein